MANQKWLFPSDPIDWLVARKFRSRDKIYALGGVPDAPTVQLVQKKQYEDELRKMAPAVLQNAYTHALWEASKMEPGNKDLFERQLTHNLPRAKADLDHWSKASYWTLEEATALSFGRDPEFINWKALESSVLISSFAQDYKRVRDLAQRAKHMQQLYDPVTPGFFIAWVKRSEIAFSTELEERVLARGHHIQDWKTLYDQVHTAHEQTRAEMAKYRETTVALLAQKDDQIAVQAHELDGVRSELEAKVAEPIVVPSGERPLGKERESLLKLIIGMAVIGYRYDPGANRSEAIRDIFDDLERSGVPLDQDTVRKWLRQGAALLPPEALKSRDS